MGFWNGFPMFSYHFQTTSRLAADHACLVNTPIPGQLQHVGGDMYLDGELTI